MDSQEILKDLQIKLDALKQSDASLKKAQGEVARISKDREQLASQVNDLKIALDRSLNEQLQAAGVEPTRPGVFQR